MDVLVDYYNLSQQRLRLVRQNRHSRVADLIVDRIVSAIVPGHLASGEERLDLRLYGGWYEDETLTRDAQEIDAVLRRNYPVALTTDLGRRIVVNAQLAYSMRCDASHHLWYTLRSKAAPRGIEFLDPSEAGCSFPDGCPLRPGYDFFVRGHCPEEGCKVTSRLVTRRREQKLVDTMLAADVFFNAYSNESQIAVVSSDDDLWPAIRTALQFGMAVVHVHTIRGHATRPHYLHGTGAGYVQTYLPEGA